ncbi:hypothetical protein C1H46_041354 [Malus baccata]|uniref:Uncharacterized protein n=1 Tax=Malus baccata TaxID=106549 RepID=A0A540KFV1_MALBA|nr:hypothetical protein C1H46_041354 [Malus baccata]
MADRGGDAAPTIKSAKLREEEEEEAKQRLHRPRSRRCTIVAAMDDSGVCGMCILIGSYME